MKKWIFLVGFLLSATAGMAQNAAITGFCLLGATPAKTQGSNSTNNLQGVIPRCTVTIYLTGTTSKATIYTDSFSTPLANPFTADVNGQWTFYAATGQAYDAVLSGGGNNPACVTPPNCYATPVTLVGLGGGGGGGGSANIVPSPHFSMFYQPIPGSASVAQGDNAILTDGSGNLASNTISTGSGSSACGSATGCIAATENASTPSGAGGADYWWADSGSGGWVAPNNVTSLGGMGVTNAGIFTGAYRNYLRSIINAADPAAIYAHFTGAGTNLDAMATAVKVPVGATQYQVNASASYLQNESATVNAVSYSGYAYNNVAGGKTWASNAAYIDNPSAVCGSCRAIETDSQPQGLATDYATGLGADYANMGVQVSLFAPNAGQFGTGVWVNRGQVGQWNIAYKSEYGAAQVGLWLGPVSATVFPANSQTIRIDDVVSNGVVDTTNLYNNATTHSFTIAPPAAGQTIIQSGNLSLVGTDAISTAPAVVANSQSTTVAGLAAILNTSSAISNLFGYGCNIANTTQWTTCIRTFAGSAVYAAWIGQQATGISQPSQLFRFDGTTAGNTVVSAFIGSDALGNFDIIPDASHGVVITQGGLTLSNGDVLAHQYTDGGGTDTFATVDVTSLNLTAIAGTQCLHSVAGVVSGTGGDCTGSYTPITAVLTTSAATTDNVTVTGMTSSGHCSLTATNASAAANIATTYISAKATNQITVTHAVTASMTYDVVCAAN